MSESIRRKEHHHHNALLMKDLRPEESKEEMRFWLRKRVAEKNFKDQIANSPTKEGKTGNSPLGKPTLPEGKFLGSTSPADTLKELAKAFSDIYEAQAKTTESQTTDYSQSQDLQNSMSQIVIKSLDNFVQKMKAETDCLQEQSKELLKVEEQLKIFNPICSAVGYTMMAIGIISSIFTFGTSLGLFGAGEAAADVAGDVISNTLKDVAKDAATKGLEDGAASGANTEIEMEEMGGAAADIEPVPADGAPDVEGGDGVSAAEDDVGLTESTDQNTEQAAEKSEEPKNYLRRGCRWIAKKLALGAASTLAGMPMLMRGVSDKKLAHVYQDLSVTQQNVGKAQAQMQENNLYYQFYQQITTRSGDMAQQLSGCLVDILKTDGDIMNGYRQISYGLADAV